jgi:hypothetical protein
VKLGNIGAGVVLCSGLYGCGAGPGLPPFDPSREVDVRGYEQGGEPIDRQSLADGLSREKEAGPLARKAKGLAIAANVFAAVGGGLVGWTVGDHLGGGSNSPWALAYVGGGMVVTGLGLAVWSGAVFDDAVSAHNSMIAEHPEARLDLRGTSLVLSW